ncbi:histidine kinase [Arthrobacter sp. efr-133-R2A-120]|uniref:sensor histidine kinase n=1 Tax=Arthrobacter sp. efr-133-R2A-120 TaxID=3040277 RepID=UPI00254CC20E|nr:histidine kinase [Arthrobacter sp. efr-133-R2A-120]
MKRSGPAEAARNNVHASAGWRGFWAYTALPAGARLALAAVVAVGLLVDGVLALVAQTPMPTAAVYVGALIAIGAFAWRPPIAAVVLAACGLVATFLGAGGPYSLALAVSVGLVTSTCSRWLSVSYCVITAGWALVAAGVGQGLAQGGGIGSVAAGLASGLIGWGFRGGRAREHQLAADIDRLKRESAAAVQMERDRIADELHNIIAHDITTVVMRARALELVDDPVARDTSRRAITDAATQALTDIRRMLRLVQGTDETVGEAGAGAVSLAATLESLRLGLGSMGASVELSFPGSELSISNSIETTLVHIAREAATNVMKHARQSPSIRLAVTSDRECITLQVWNAPSSGGEDLTADATGYGLKRMNDRVMLLGGTFKAGGDETGWTVTATMPRF